MKTSLIKILTCIAVWSLSQIGLSKTESLEIIIKQPTALPIFQAYTNFINFCGTIFSTNEIHSVTWENSLGGSGNCEFLHSSNSWHKHKLEIQEGTNIIFVQATDIASNSASDFIAVLYNTIGEIDTNPPSIIVTSPADGTVTNTHVIDVYGTASDDSGFVLVTVDNVVAGTTNWMKKIHLTKSTNEINITAYDVSSNTTTKIIKVIKSEVDTEAPILTVLEPADWTTTTESNILVYGRASDNSGNVLVKVNDTFAGTTNWLKKINLELGTNIIHILAEDPSYNITSNSIHIVRKNIELQITTTSEELGGFLNETYKKQLETNKDKDDTDLWTIKGLPEKSGLISTDTGLIQGVPAEAAEYPVTVEVINRYSGETTSTNLTIKIESMATEPVLLNSMTIDGVAGEPYSAAIQIAGIENNDEWFFNAASGMPDGVTLTPEGRIEGVPETSGSYRIFITASNSSAVSSKHYIFSRNSLDGKLFFNIVSIENEFLSDINVKKTTVKVDWKHNNKDKLLAKLSFLAPAYNFNLTNENWTIDFGNYPVPLNILKNFKNGKGIKFYNSPEKKTDLSIKGKAVINKADNVIVTVKIKNANFANVYGLKKDKKAVNLNYMPVEFIIGTNSGHIILPMRGKTKVDNKTILKLRK